MAANTDNPNDKKPARTVGDNLQEILTILKRSEISLPQAIVIAAVVISLGIIFS